MSSYIVGVDVGGTFIKTAIVSWDKRVIGKSSCPTHAQEGPQAVMDAMEGGVRDLVAQNKISMSEVMAVGIGAPGPMNWKTGVVYSPPNLAGWKDVPLGTEMQKRLNVPCFIDNDANAACYGEFWLGAGQGAENMAVLTLGTGVGGGLIVFGLLLRGEDGTAAELGHLKVQRDGRLCGCGSRGCLEGYASVTGMVRTAIEALESGRSSLIHDLCQGDHARITGKMIFEAAQEEDEVALWTFEETATWLGLGIASIINFQNPEKIVLCGGMIDAGEMLFEPVRRVAKANAFQVPAERCKIVPAGLGADSGVLGAAGCALARYEAAN
ncbi:MAG: ROK family glucokinase [Candidatus Hydrogenedentes bacterium]|nr:ROK family glucokinase [Candidatus Hydrogenedentota bacterium]